MATVNVSPEIKNACIDAMSDFIDNLTDGMTPEQAEQYAEEVQGGGTPMETQDYNISPENPTEGEQSAERILYQQNNDNVYFHDKQAQEPVSNDEIDKTFGNFGDEATGGSFRPPVENSGREYDSGHNDNEYKGFGDEQTGGNFRPPVGDPNPVENTQPEGNNYRGFGDERTGGNFRPPVDDGFRGNKEERRRHFGHPTPDTNDMREQKRKAARDLKPRKTTFQNGQVPVGSKDIKFTAAYTPVDWSIDDFSSENPIKNTDRLRNLVSKLVFDTVGGWSRIRELYVSDNRIIVNGIMVVPQVNRSVIEKLPLDSAEYIKNGMLAYLFNWGYLRKMTRMGTLGIDSVDLFCTCIADDLGYSRTANIKSLFGACENLRTVIIGDEIINLEDLNTPKVTKANKEVSKRFRFKNLVDGYHLDVYKATDGVQNYSVQSLKNYANNRGNKFILWWWGGMLARTTGVVASGAVNLGAHLVGGIFKTIKSAVSDAKGQETE